MYLFLDEACSWAKKLSADINLLPLMPDKDNNFGGSLVLNLEKDDVTCNPRIKLFQQNNNNNNNLLVFLYRWYYLK